MIVLRLLFFILVAVGVFYGVKSVLFKYLSLDSKIEALKESEKDVRSSLSDAEQQLSEDRKTIKEAKESL